MTEHTVEIQVLEATLGLETNFVGVVVPAELTDVHHDDTVTFKNATNKAMQGVRVWFPVPWDADHEEVVHLPELGNEVTLTVDTTGWEDGDHPIMYQVFCDGIRELAVGNSPPKMVVTKP
jgi:hypothetical protein